MIVHIYKIGEREADHQTVTTDRVTFRMRGHDRYGAGLLLGTHPHVKVIPLEELRWFWVESE